MIAKSISYAHLFKDIATISSADRRALFAGWAVAKYVLGLQLDQDEATLVREAHNIGSYGPDHRSDDTRVLDAAIFNLEEGTEPDKALEFAYRVAASGKTSLRQIVVAYGDEPVSNEMAARHRDIFRRVLRAENKPMIYSNHGDTRFGHFHLAVCTADAKLGKVGEWGQGKEIEALHIALAICEAQDNLQPEPNRRYVADATGVYHTWSGFRIAEPNGDMINRGAFKAVEAEQAEFDAEVLAPSDAYVGQALPNPKAIKLLARAVIRQAKSWDEWHRGLARVGIRYEPYRVNGEIAGGHLVANGVLDKSDDRIPASDVNAGYKRLCNKLGKCAYEAPASDIRVRSFVAPAYRKKGLNVGHDLSHDIDLAEQAEWQAQIDSELEEFERALKERHEEIRRQRVEAKKAREKMKSRDEKRRQHNLQQKRERASREEAEKILRELRLSFDRETGRKRKGPRPKTEPASTVLWGEYEKLFLDHDDKPGTWTRRYSIEQSDHSRTYRLNDEIAFVETASFIAMYSDDRQAKIDALRCAHEKFGKVRVVGPASYRREMLLLAAQMEIPLHAKQVKEAEKLLAKSRVKKGQVSEVIYDSAWFDRPKRKKANTLSPEELQMRQVREQRGARFTSSVLQDFRRRNARDDKDHREGKPNSAKIPIAHRFLTDMNCDRMLLCVSQYSVDGVRFLDDEELLKKFASLPQALVRPEIQQRLEAIRRVQQAKREWILTGLAKGEFQVRGDKLVIPDSYGTWPAGFVDSQRLDATFIRQLREAAEGSHSGKIVDFAVRPEIAVWREAREGSDQEKALAPYIVDEWMRTSARTDRHVVFKTMTYTEAEQLRRTSGLAAEAYQGYFYQKDGESDQAFARRQRIAERSSRQQGR